MAIYKQGVIQPLVSFLGVEILTPFLFLWNNFWSRYARKPIKGSENSWDSLVSKKHLGQNVGPVNGRPRPGKLGHKNAKHPHLWRPSKRTPNPKLKIFFFWFGTTRLAESVEGLNTSLAAATGELWPKKCRPLKCLAWALKGFNRQLSRRNKTSSLKKYFQSFETSKACPLWRALT